MSSALAYASVPETAAPIAGGTFVAVVGPSGAGKDSLIAYARRTLADDPRFSFVRRVITRPSDAATEDHDTLADAAFDEAEEAGAFAVTWTAHGLRYGLPKSVDVEIESGSVAIANGSRGAIPLLRARYANVLVVEVTAAPEVLAARLAARGRESRGEVLARLARTVAVEGAKPDVVIENNGALEEAGGRLAAALRAAANRAHERCFGGR